MKKIMKFLKYPLIIILILALYVAWYVQAGLKYSSPHFHANFALYINGERIDFSLPEYSEDVAGCSIGDTIYAKDRVHLHENNPDTIHIHHDGVTWWDFFANNDMMFNESVFVMDDGEIYSNNEKDTLRFILNGNEMKNPSNFLINSADQLLIAYGEESVDELTLGKFLDVSDNAAEYNAKHDPGSCSGGHGNSKIALIEQFFHSFMGH